MTTRRRLGAAATALALGALTLGSCGSGGDDAAPAVALDGTPRIPDAEGELVDIAGDLSTIELDGGRTFEVPEDLLSFSAADGSVQPLIRWKGQYVQVGLDGGAAEWVGGVAAVVRLPGQSPLTYATGVLVDGDDTSVVLRSGAVFRHRGLALPAELPVAVTLTIDVAAQAVVDIQPE